MSETLLPVIAALTPVSNTILNGVMANTTSSVSVNNFNNHAFQYLATVSGNSTASLTLQSSLDNANWVQDFAVTSTANTASLTYLTGVRSYVRALFIKAGNVTASLLSVSGN